MNIFASYLELLNFSKSFQHSIRLEQIGIELLTNSGLSNLVQESGVEQTGSELVQPEVEIVSPSTRTPC